MAEKKHTLAAGWQFAPLEKAEEGTSLVRAQQKATWHIKAPESREKIENLQTRYIIADHLVLPL